MKNFFKSTAIFACMALMFGACSEDSTEDSSIPSVDFTTLTSVTPGNGKFEVKWKVPYSDQVTMCVISWSNDDLGVDDSICIEATSGENMSRTVSGLSAGTYTVSVQNYGDVEIDSPLLSTTVDVYDSSVYTSKPAVSTVMIEGSSSSIDAIVVWSGEIDDCLGVSISYTDADEKSQSVELSAIDAPIVLSNVKSGSTFNYSAYFQPEGGLDEVIFANIAETDVPEYVATSQPNIPTDVSANPNSLAINVEATMPTSGVAVQSVVVSYTNDDKTYYYLSGSAAESVTVPNVAVGTYSVAVQTMSSAGILSEKVSLADEVSVYDYDQYLATCTYPVYDGIFFEYVLNDKWSASTSLTQEEARSSDNSYDLNIRWGDMTDCYSVTFRYYDTSGVMQTETLYDFSSTTVMKEVAPDMDYYFSAVYYPGGNEDQKIELPEITRAFPEATVAKYVTSTTDYDNVVYLLDSVTLIGNAYTLATYDIQEAYDGAYTTNAQYMTDPTYTLAYQTVTIDLGKTYYLSSLTHFPYISTAYTNNNIKIFSLWGTDEDPTTSSELNKATEETASEPLAYNQIPDLSAWELLLDNVEVQQPSVIGYDYNGDGTVDTTDDTDQLTAGHKFNISKATKAVRWVRIQFIENFYGTSSSNATQYRLQELDFGHRGVVE